MVCILSAHLAGDPVASCSIAVAPLALCALDCGDWVLNEWKTHRFLGPTSPHPGAPGPFLKLLVTRAPSRPMCRRWQTTDPLPEVLLQPSRGWDDARGLDLPKEGFVVPKDVCLNISGLRDREAEVHIAPSDPVLSRAPGSCRTHVSLPGCREGAQGSRALPALPGSPPVLEPEAGWRPGPYGEVGQGSGNGVTARHPRWSVSQEGASGGWGGRMRTMEVGLEKQAPCSDLASCRPAPGASPGSPAIEGSGLAPGAPAWRHS